MSQDVYEKPSFYVDPFVVGRQSTDSLNQKNQEETSAILPLPFY